MSGFHSVRNHNIYLSTINRDPDENRYSMVFPVPNDIIFLDDVSSQRMKISLMTFGLNANWTEINSTNNQVSFFFRPYYDIPIQSLNYRPSFH